MSEVVCDTIEVIDVFEYYFVICFCCVPLVKSKNKCNSNGKVIVIVIGSPYISSNRIVIVIGRLNI